MNEPPILPAADTVYHLYCQRGDPALSVVTAQVDASSGRDRPPPSAEGVQPWFGPTPTPLAAGESQTARVSRRCDAGGPWWSLVLRGDAQVSRRVNPGCGGRLRRVREGSGQLAGAARRSRRMAA